MTQAAHEQRLAREASQPELLAAIRAFGAGHAELAERGVRAVLRNEPHNAAATLLLAEVAGAAGATSGASRLYRTALGLLPGHAETLLRLAELLGRGLEVGEAVDLLDQLIAAQPRHRRAMVLRATLLGQLGRYDAAAADQRRLLDAAPEDAGALLARGHLMRTLGDIAASATAFRSAAAAHPRLGDAWWGLADLKSSLLSDDDVATMVRAEASGGVGTPGTLDFALGRALEDRGRAADAFAHYARGNAAVRSARPHDSAAEAADIKRTMALFTPDFLTARAGAGDPSPAPIFVVGMPRAGSTLIEQILASHGAIEGTAELPYVPALAHALLEEAHDPAARYPDVLANLPNERFAELGRCYLAAAGMHRRDDRPHFIDKLPENWSHVGLIQLMLPNATIIDARREAMACGFSNYKQHYAAGRAFASDLGDIGRTYAGYARAMRHWDAVLPGRVLRVDHEALVAEPEAQVRRMLVQIGLPYDPACLTFHENRRAVRTASAAQVRRPLDRQTGEAWRPFAPWLGPLAAALREGGVEPPPCRDQ